MKVQCVCLDQGCGKQFFRKPSELSRGRGKYCSRKCLNNHLSEIMKNALVGRNQSGENNPHWKGGVKNWKPTRQYLREKQRSYRLLFPEKKRAHQLVGEAIRNGTLTRCCCVVCANPNAEAHHEDYSNPFEITWLCKECHMKRHLEINSLKKCNFNEVEPFPDGRVIIGRGAIVDAVMVEVLPRVQK